MRKLDTTPVATVQYVKKGTGRCPWVTGVTIEVAGVQVATATLGGRYSQEQALAEFRRNRGRFKLLPGAVLLGLTPPVKAAA